MTRLNALGTLTGGRGFGEGDSYAHLWPRRAGENLPIQYFILLCWAWRQ